MPPRTTVYDAFRLGRRRLDRDLVADIVEVLGGDPVPAVAPITPTTPLAAVASLPEPSTEVTPTQDAADETPDAEPVAARAAGFHRPRPATVAKLLVLALVLNVVGQSLMTDLDLPIWQDMTGTAVAAIALGPWWGAGVAVASMAVDVALFGDTGFAYLPVAVAGALLWGYGVRWWALARSTVRFLGLSLAVAVTCTAISVPITYLKYDGFTLHDSARLTQSLAESLPWLVAAVFVSNLVVSVVDKLVSGFIALALLETLSMRRAWLRDRLRGRRSRSSALSPGSARASRR